jgi:hypothetical protein
MHGIALRIRRRPLVAMAVVAVVAAALTGTAIGLPSSDQGGIVNGVKVVRGTDLQETSSQTFVNFPDAVTTITVPSGQRALILARFSAESSCLSAEQSGWCSVRILIGGIPAEPAQGLQFKFDSTPRFADDAFAYAHSMERSRSVGAGTHTVRVQWATRNARFQLDDWHLTVERAVGNIG